MRPFTTSAINFIDSRVAQKLPAIEANYVRFICKAWLELNKSPELDTYKGTLQRILEPYLQQYLEDNTSGLSWG